MTRMLLLCAALHLPTQSSMPNTAKTSTTCSLEKSPQWIKFSLTLSQMGQVASRHLSFACDCQTHGDVTSFVLFLPICATLGILTVCQTTSTKNMCGKNQIAFSAPPLLQCIVMSGLMEGSEGCPVGCNVKGW